MSQIEVWLSPSHVVAERVRHWRKERGLNQQQLAERLDEQGTPIGNTGLSRLERGERRVTVEDLCALARALHVSPALLLCPPDDTDLRVGDRTIPQPYATAWVAGAAGLPDRESAATEYATANEALRAQLQAFRQGGQPVPRGFLQVQMANWVADAEPHEYRRFLTAATWALGATDQEYGRFLADVFLADVFLADAGQDGDRG